MLIRLVLLVLLIPQLVFGADWYVDCAYVGTESGTEAQPYDTIQEAVNVATGGDTFYIADSTVGCTLSASISWGSGWTADNTKVTTFTSYDAGNGSVTIQRPDEASARVAALINANGNHPFSSTSHPAYVTVKNIKFTGGSDRLLRIYGPHMLVYGCEFYGSTNGAITFNANNAAAIYNYIHSFTSSFGAIDTNGSVFSYNWIEDLNISSSYGAIDMGSFRDEVRGNVIILNANNLNGIRATQDLNTIEHNTIIGTSTASQKGVLITANAEDVKILNNIFYKFDGTSAIPVDGSASGASISYIGYNAYYDSNSNNLPSSLVNLNLSNDVTGSGDPFVDSANDDYCVTGSTAEDAAYPAGSLLDIGALECTASGGGGNTYIFAVD